MIALISNAAPTDFNLRGCDDVFVAYSTARDLAWATLRYEDAHDAALLWVVALCLSPDEMAAGGTPVDVGSPPEEFANWLAALDAEHASDCVKPSRALRRAWGRLLDAHLPPDRRLGPL